MIPPREKIIIVTTFAAVLAVAALGVTALLLSRRQLELRLADTRQRLHRAAAATAERIETALPLRLAAAERDPSDPIVSQSFLADAEGRLLSPAPRGGWAGRFRMIFLDPAPPEHGDGYTLIPVPAAAAASEEKTSDHIAKSKRLMLNQMYLDRAEPDLERMHPGCDAVSELRRAEAAGAAPPALSSPGQCAALQGGNTALRSDLKSERRDQSAQSAEAAPAAAPPVATTRFQRAAAGRSSGRLPVVVGGRLTLLLWRRASDGMISGVEIAGERLLSEAFALFPTPMPGERLTLRDAVGKVCFASGEAIAAPTPAASVALPPDLLPGMRVEAEFDAVRLERSAMLPWGFMVTALLGAVFFAGSILLLLVRRELREAGLRNGFVSQVSHELKTPLTAIRMYVEMLRDHPELPAEKQQRYLATVEEECVRLNRMVENVLDFNRLAGHRKHCRIERFDLAACLRDAEPRFTALLDTGGLALALELPPEPFPVRFDRDALIAIMENLLGNAVKYAASGGRVVVRLDPGRRELHCRDFGPGVPERLRKKIFERFFRGNDALTAAAGFGLGLAIARDTARRLGGELVCRGERPGADFILQLPEEESDEPDPDCGR